MSTNEICQILKASNVGMQSLKRLAVLVALKD